MHYVVLVSGDVASSAVLAAAHARAGEPATLVLLDEAAAAARGGARAARSLTGLLDAGVAVVAHDDALRRRGVRREDLLDGLKPITLDELADLVGDGADRVIWL